MTWGQRPVMKMKVKESVTNDADSVKMKIFDPTRIETATRDFSFYDKEEESGIVSPAQFTRATTSCTSAWVRKARTKPPAWSSRTSLR